MENKNKEIANTLLLSSLPPRCGQVLRYKLALKENRCNLTDLVKLLFDNVADKFKNKL